MKRPAFQFYPADWRNNAKLRRCSFHERGVWIEVIGLLHDSDEYGVLRWPMREIANGAGCRVTDLQGLHDKTVLKGLESGAFAGWEFRPRHGRRVGDPVMVLAPCDGPIYFSSRMVEDEYKRLHAGEKTRFAASNDAPSRGEGAAPSQRHGERQGAPPIRAPSQREGDGSTASSSSTSKNKGEVKSRARCALAAAPPPDGVVAEVWLAWIRHKGRKQTAEADEMQRKHLAEWREQGHDVNLIVERGIAAGNAGLFAPQERRANGHTPSRSDLKSDNINRVINGEKGHGRVVNGTAERVDRTAVPALPVDLREQGADDVRGSGPGRSDVDVGGSPRKVRSA